MHLPWAEIGLVLVLVVVNAAFAGSEVALISCVRANSDGWSKKAGGGGWSPSWQGTPTSSCPPSRSASPWPGSSLPPQPQLPWPSRWSRSWTLGGAAEPVAVLVVTVVLTYLTLVIGELAPKRIALQRPTWAKRAARPLTLVTTLTRPAVWLLSSPPTCSCAWPAATPTQRETVTEEEVRDLVATQASFSPQHRTILVGALEITDRVLRDVLVPRRQVVALAAPTPVPDAVRTLVSTTHGRAPVYRGDLDDIIGVAHLVDLVDARGRVADHLRPALALPESMRVLDALRRMQTERQTLAIVINEYGGTEGIVTVEDLLEELVGDIYDEFDRDSHGIQRQPDGSIVLPGSFPSTICPTSASPCPRAATRPWPAWSWTAWGACPTPATPSKWTAGSWRSWPSTTGPSPHPLHPQRQHRPSSRPAAPSSN